LPDLLFALPVSEFGLKGALPAQLRAEASLTVRWIAQPPGTGTRGHLNHLPYDSNRSGPVRTVTPVYSAARDTQTIS
jgi:hypothetical protein